jgi:hypothetical protein
MEQAYEIQVDYSVVATTLIFAISFALLLAAATLRSPLRTVAAPPAWIQRRFGYVVYALIFLGFYCDNICRGFVVFVPYWKGVHDPLTPAWRCSSGVATEPPGHPKAQAASIGSRQAICRTLGPMTFMHEGRARPS